MNENELYKNIKQVINKNQYYYQIKNKEDRETVLNDTFMNVWKNINNNNLVNDWEEIKNYVYVSSRNNCLQYLRRKKREKSHINIDDVSGKEYNPTMDYDTINDDFIQERVKWVMDSLTLDIDKEIFELRFQGYSLDEISEKLNICKKRIVIINNCIRQYLCNKEKGRDYKRKLRKTEDKKYVVINSLGEKIFESLTKKGVANKYDLETKRINNWIDTGLKFGDELIIKTELC